MLDMRYLFKKKYSNSRALVIGINKYKNGSPLGFAVNDAVEFKKTLVDKLDFKNEHVTLLVDEDATKAAIMSSYLRLAREDVDLDERIIIFFAGHGHTQSGHRGDVGFLMPHDANLEDISTLIRWKDLTESTDLIRAKHMLFIMDACYGGLALKRGLAPGSARFLNDMLLRRSRQVLTAGKANEVVSDADGPLPGHSIFTGHLLEALRGKAVPENGVLTANALMSYVYAKVSGDPNSDQTPHYGQFEGDGDLILITPPIGQSTEEKNDVDTLVIVPHVDEPTAPATTYEKIKHVKSLLANDGSSIELHDTVVAEVRQFLSRSDVSNFPVEATQNKEEIATRIVSYDEVTLDIAMAGACIAYWGKPSHFPLLQKIFTRSADNISMMSGSTTWLAMRNYPTVIQAYCAGIASIEAGRFDSLFAMFNSTFGADRYDVHSEALADRLMNSVLNMSRSNLFAQLPGHDRHHVPMSEHLYKVIQPKLDDLFFIGKGYESLFDDFEVLLALICMDIKLQRQQGTWAPVGRYGWKAHGGGNNPIARIREEIQLSKSAWPPLRAGFFGGDVERLQKALEALVDFVGRLNMH